MKTTLAFFLLCTATGLLAQPATEISRPKVAGPAPLAWEQSIHGIVKDEQGSPLAGVKVQMCGLEKGGNREIRLGEMPCYWTDKEGRFVVPVREEDMRYDFYFDRPGYAPTFLYAVTNNGPELTVVLTRGLTVTGTVKRLVNGTVEPVTGTEVELRLPYVDLWYQQRTLTDPNGRYTFHVTPETGGRKWQVVFAGEVVQLDVKEGRQVQGPDFEVTVTVHQPTEGTR